MRPFSFFLFFLSLLPFPNPQDNNTSKPNPSTLIVPHHNLVAHIRSEAIQQVATQRDQTNLIFLIGPDHFSKDQTQINYANRSWQIQNTTLSFPNHLMTQDSKLMTVNNPLLSHDHAIYNLLDDIATHFPQAKLFPITIGQDVPLANLADISAFANTHCRYDCLLIASVDFSHYLPQNLATVHDYETLEHLTTLTLENHQDIEVDSPQSIYLAIQHSKHANSTNFHLFSHTNSGQLGNNPFLPTTSHIIGWYQSAPLNKQKFRTLSTLKRSDLKDQRTDTTNQKPNPYPFTTYTFLHTLPQPFQPIMEDRLLFGTDHYYQTDNQDSIHDHLTILPGDQTTIQIVEQNIVLYLSPEATASAAITPDQSFTLAISPLNQKLQQQLQHLDTPHYHIDPHLQTITSHTFPKFATILDSH